MLDEHTGWTESEPTDGDTIGAESSRSGASDEYRLGSCGSDSPLALGGAVDGEDSSSPSDAPPRKMRRRLADFSSDDSDAPPARRRHGGRRLRRAKETDEGIPLSQLGEASTDEDEIDQVADLSQMTDPAADELTQVELDAVESAEVPASAVKDVYFFTLSEVNESGRKGPKDFTRESFADLLRDAYRSAMPFNLIAKMAVWFEKGSHFHAVLKATTPHRWKAIRAYLQRQGVYVNIKTIPYHLACRYCTLPSPKKALSGLDAEPYCSPGHPPMGDACKVPRTHAASCARAGHATGEAVVPEKRHTKKVKAYFAITQLRLRTATEFVAYANDEARENRTDLLDFYLDHSDLGGFIRRVWESADAPNKARREQLSAREKLEEALTAQCICAESEMDKGWTQAASEILGRNGYTKQDFAAAIRKILDGPDKTTCAIFLVGPSNCGKSLLTNPLQNIFDSVARKPAGKKSTYPLQSLVGCDIALWHEVDDRIFDIIDVNDMLLWLEGEEWTIAKPKNTAAADVVWNPAGIPVIFTGGRRLRHDDPRKEEMLDNRLQYLSLWAPCPQAEVRKVAKCPRCFAQFVLT